MWWDLETSTKGLVFLIRTEDMTLPIEHIFKVLSGNCVDKSGSKEIG